MKLELKFLHNHSRARRAQSVSLIHPGRDWGIGLLLFVVVTGIGSVVLGRLYFFHQAADTFTAGSVPEITRYREEVAREALEVYRARAVAYTNLKATGYQQSPVADLDTPTTTASTAVPAVDEAQLLESEVQ